MDFTGNLPGLPSQNPPWLLLTVAALGVAGTLLGVVITQWLSARRAEAQWERDKEQEAVRWQRERDERREQWDREDATRWEQERLSAYSGLLAAIERWEDIAREARPRAQLIGRLVISKEDVARLNAAHRDIVDAQVSVELLAPEKIRAKARSIHVATSWFATNLSHEAERSPAEIDEEAEKHLLRIHRVFRDLLDLIRAHLKIEVQEEAIPSAVEPPAEERAGSESANPPQP